VNILFTDASGVPCLDAANFVRFAFAGDGRLLDNMGTSHGSRRIQLANGRACIDVECKSSGTVSAYLEKEGKGGLVDIGR
jgi:beta-galactosidase